MIVDRWTVTVASVGDSRCILDTQGGPVTTLTVDHRLEENIEEYDYISNAHNKKILFLYEDYYHLHFAKCRRERVTASGGEVGRLSIFGGAEVSI